MARTRSEGRRRIEAEYRPEARTVDAAVDFVGRMTIAFCASAVCSGEWACLPPQ